MPACSAAGDEEGLWLYHVRIILTSDVKVSSRDITEYRRCCTTEIRQPVLCKKETSETTSGIWKTFPKTIAFNEPKYVSLYIYSDAICCVLLCRTYLRTFRPHRYQYRRYEIAYVCTFYRIPMVRPDVRRTLAHLIFQPSQRRITIAR